MKFKQQRKTKNMIITLVQAELQEAILTYLETHGMVNQKEGIEFQFQATRGEDGTMATVNIPFQQRTKVADAALEGGKYTIDSIRGSVAMCTTSKAIRTEVDGTVPVVTLAATPVPMTQEEEATLRELETPADPEAMPDLGKEDGLNETKEEELVHAKPVLTEAPRKIFFGKRD